MSTISADPAVSYRHTFTDEDRRRGERARSAAQRAKRERQAELAARRRAWMREDRRLRDQLVDVELYGTAKELAQAKTAVREHMALMPAEVVLERRRG